MKQSVLLSGPDALDLFHRITTLDINRIHSSSWLPGLILNLQGKIQSFFKAKKTDSTTLAVQFDGAFLSLFEHYTFNEHYTLKSMPPSQQDEESELNEFHRISSLIPKLGHEFNENGETNPLEINLRAAIHENKGCYPGQEIIEKIISLGSPARKLGLLAGNTQETLPTPLYDLHSGQEIGTLTSLEPSQSLALGILKRTHHQPGMKVKTRACEFTLLKIAL